MKLSIGALFDGRYQIESKIGSGGMADVYKASDEKKKRDVAIKILRDESAEDAEFLRRFRAEALAVKQLNHETIVRLFDVGEAEGIPYIVLEYIDGKTLKQIIREKGPLPQDEAARYAIKICEGLQHAHQRGLIHRDVKPQNIMITQGGKVKIMDFGIVRFANSNTVTYAGGEVLGSVHYISPEQARGETVSANSDIYSLGIVLFEMLTGQLPFDNENSVTVVLRQIQEDVPRPSSLRAGLGRAFDDMVCRATQKDPTLRYRNLNEMKKDLQRAIREPEGDFVKVDAAVPMSLARKFFRARTRVGAVAALMLSVALVGGVVVTGILILQTNKNRSANEYTIVIPQLIGKREEDAFARCQALGLQMIVRNQVSSESYLPGQVAKQDPLSGSYGKQGDVIYVSISTGSSQVEVPNFAGLSLDEAVAILTELRLEYEVEYELSEKTLGLVLHQTPNGGGLLEQGDAVTLWVSGQQSDEIEIPMLVNLRMDDAMMQLKNSGIDRVKMRYIVDEKSVSGLVQTQSPKAGERVLGADQLEIGVVKPRNMNYYLEIAPTVNIEAPDSQVRLVTLVQRGGVEVEQIWVEREMQPGTQILPVTLESDQAGKQLLRITVNGQKVKEMEVTLRSHTENNTPETQTSPN